jgi:uncharacterized protein (TIGR00251 family)
MKPSPCLAAHEGALWLQVKAQPRAKRNEIAGLVGTELKIRITAPPVDSAANEALIEFLAKTLKCPRRAVTLIRGQTSPHKVFRLDGVNLEQISAVLGV